MLPPLFTAVLFWIGGAVLAVTTFRSREPGFERLTTGTLSALTFLVSVLPLMYNETDSVWLWRAYYIVGACVIVAFSASLALLLWNEPAKPHRSLTPDTRDLLVIEFRFAAVFMVAVGLGASGMLLVGAYQGSAP